MSKRKCIGPVYMSYPARDIGHWIGDKIFKIIASIACVFIWMGIHYVLLGVVNFNKNSFMEGATETSVEELFKTDGNLIVLGVISVGIVFWVFRSRIGSRRKRKKGKLHQ